MLNDPHADKRATIESCATCRFFFPTPKCHETGGKGAHVTGDCRRMPPPPNYNGHPTVYTDGWCGEYAVDKHKVDHLVMIEKKTEKAKPE